MTPLPNRLRQAIGGKWLIYIPPFAILLPVWFSGSILSTKDLSDWNEVLVVTGINLVALGLCSLEFLLFRVTIWRSSHQAPERITSLWLVVLGGVILGATKAVSTVYAAAWLLGTPTTDLWGRVIAGIALGVIVVVIVPVTLSELEVYRSRREELITEIVRREVAQPQSAEFDDAGALRDFVSRALATLATVRSKPESLPDVLDHLRVNEVRPLSHHIWNREQAKIPDFTLGNLISVSLSNTRYVVLPVVVGFGLLMGPSQIAAYGLYLGAAALLVQFMIIASALSLANVLPPAGKRWGIGVFLSINVLISGIIAVVTTVTFGPIPAYLPLQADLAVFQVLLTLTLFTSVFSLTRRTHRAVEDDLLRLTPDLGTSELKRAQQSRADRELAQLLHSQVQNVLLAKSVHVKREMLSPTLTDADRTALLAQNLSELEAYVRSLIAPDSSQSAEDLASRIQSVIAAWEPVIDLKFVPWPLPKSLELDALGDVIIAVLQEGIANAVRHGLAESVRVQVTQSASSVSIVIDDDGLGPRGGSAGLGSYLFMSIPHSSWELSATSALGGARLHVSISPSSRTE